MFLFTGEPAIKNLWDIVAQVSATLPHDVQKPLENGHFRRFVDRLSSDPLREKHASLINDISTNFWKLHTNKDGFVVFLALLKKTPHSVQTKSDYNLPFPPNYAESKIRSLTIFDRCRSTHLPREELSELLNRILDGLQEGYLTHEMVECLDTYGDDEQSGS